LIVDERWNSGGFIPEFFVERLRRQLMSYYAPREGIDFKTPGAAIYGPKVMLINEFSGSGGDAFPFYFRRYEIGPLVGKRTWGGLVGISGGLPMIDNGSVTAPSFAIWTADNGKSEWVVENKGVAPDYDVDSRPDLIVAGHDPQLEKQLILSMMNCARIRLNIQSGRPMDRRSRKNHLGRRERLTPKACANSSPGQRPRETARGIFETLKALAGSC